VLFIADNGTPRQVTEPPFAREKAKGTVYEPGVNVPLIVAGPAVVGMPRENIELVSAVDLFATVAELCGVTVSGDLGPLDSVSFVPYLSNPGHASLRSTVFTEEFDGSIPNANGQAAIRDARYKLIRRYPQPGPEELYDLLRDPFEISNLIGGPLTREQRVAYHRLAAELEKLRPTG
jgi:arylsulfatase A-like enzyme